ncbi:MAG: alpha-N-arabinofuranosidase [Acidobacteria bacterium]|nr:alpha-N-arabinofuranosidase [Acidobacteriota bacterium]
MNSLTRRGLGAVAGGALLALGGRGAVSEERKIAVNLQDEIGTIRPELHSHFAEHLGSCTYGGMWVGRDSPIPNIRGHRKQAVEWLRALGIPVLRWPGGCFADDYHWRDGIGPAAKRPKRVNIWWGMYTEDNSFGTHEFIDFCKLIEAKPYLAGNVGSGTPRELRDWVEYCNYPGGSTLSEERAANGAKEPFGVKYWGVGNENWGCGGYMTPDEYAGHYRRFANYLRPGGLGRDDFLIACGPYGNNADWTRRFFTSMGTNASMVNGFAMHFYSGSKSEATKFTVEAMREQLSSFAKLEKAVQDHQIGLMVDEWGVWDRIPPEDEKRHGKLWQQITMRGAVAAALGLNLFHRQAEKLVMCNIAQLMNVLHSLLLTDGARCIRTSTYYTYELLKPHRGKTAVRVENPEAGALDLSVSASRKDGELVITCVNPRHDIPMKVSCAVRGAKVVSAEGRMIHHPDLNACNTFEQPDVIVPMAQRVDVQGEAVSFELPALSVLTIQAKVSEG